MLAAVACSGARRRLGARSAARRARPMRAKSASRMTRLRKRIAERLKEAQNTAAMLTTFNEVDMTGVMALRDRLQGRIREEAWRAARLHVASSSRPASPR